MGPKLGAVFQQPSSSQSMNEETNEKLGCNRMPLEILQGHQTDVDMYSFHFSLTKTPSWETLCFGVEKSTKTLFSDSTPLSKQFPDPHHFSIPDSRDHPHGNEVQWSQATKREGESIRSGAVTFFGSATFLPSIKLIESSSDSLHTMENWRSESLKGEWKRSRNGSPFAARPQNSKTNVATRFARYEVNQIQIGSSTMLKSHASLRLSRELERRVKTKWERVSFRQKIRWTVSKDDPEGRYPPFWLSFQRGCFRKLALLSSNNWPSEEWQVQEFWGRRCSRIWNRFQHLQKSLLKGSIDFYRRSCQLSRIFFVQCLISIIFRQMRVCLTSRATYHVLEPKTWWRWWCRKERREVKTKFNRDQQPSEILLCLPSMSSEIGNVHGER